MFVTLLFALSSVGTHAAINTQIPFQGTLTTASSTPVTDGAYDMVFRLYDTASGGSSLWTGTYTTANGNPVRVTDGIFSVLLGSGAGNDISGVNFDSADLYLGITVESDSEMTPRQRFGAAPYAFNADTVDGLHASAFAQLGSNATFVNATTTNLIVDTVVVNDNFTITGALADSSASVGVGGYVLQTTGAGVRWVATSTLGISGGGGTFGADINVTELASEDFGDFTCNGTTCTLDSSYLTTVDVSVDTNLSVSATGLELSGDAIALSTGYTIPLIASTTAWQNLLTTALTSTAGDWTGTFDGQAGSYYRDLSNATGIMASTSLASEVLVASEIDSEIKLEALLAGVINVFTNNDGALDDDDLSNNSTTDLSEGAHLYFTNDRVATYITGSTSISLLGQRIGETELDIAGTPDNGAVLQASSTVSGGFVWVATSTLGISGNSLFAESGATTYLSNLTNSLAVGTTSANATLTVAGDINIDNGFTNAVISYLGTPLITASTTNDSLTFGEGSGASLQATGLGNVFIGYNAGNLATSTDYSFAAGFEAGRANLASHIIAVGYQAAESNTGQNTIAFGYNAGNSNTGQNVFVAGQRAGYGNSGDNNTFIGYQSGDTALGDNNNFLGWRSGRLANTSNSNFFGYRAGETSTSSDFNNFFGQLSGVNNVGSDNNFFGRYSGESNFGSGNNFIGRNAGRDNSGSNNNIIGYEAGSRLQSTSSVIIGAESYRGGAGTITGGSSLFQAVDNVAVGYRAGYSAQTGADNNILLGYQAADSLTTGANNIIIGYDIEAPSNTADNQLNIGNLIFGTGVDGTGTSLSSGNIGIRTQNPTVDLAIDDDDTGINGGTNTLDLATAGLARLAIDSSGNIQFNAYGAGTLQTDASGNITVSSDERLKENLETYTVGLDAVLALNPITYNWASTTDLDQEYVYAGFSAQNVQAALPLAVGEDQNGFLTLQDRPILAAVVNAIADIWDVVTGNQEKIDDLEDRIAQLEAELGVVVTEAERNHEGTDAGDDQVESSIATLAADDSEIASSTGTSTLHTTASTTDTVNDDSSVAESATSTESHATDIEELDTIEDEREPVSNTGAVPADEVTTMDEPEPDQTLVEPATKEDTVDESTVATEETNPETI